MTRKIPEADIPDLVRRYQAGETITSIAASYGCSRTIVRSYLRQAGTPRRVDGKIPDVSQLIARYHAGEPIASLAASYGCLKTTIHTRLAQAGVPQHRSRKIPEADTASIISRYHAGESARAIAASYGCDEKIVYRRLAKAGIAARPLRLPVDSGAIVRRYHAGESEKALAEAYGVSRLVIRRRLLDHGVPIRSRHAAQQLRMDQTTPAERQRITRAAHAALRAKPREFFKAVKRTQARVWQATRSKVGNGESQLAGWLQERGIVTTPQLAADIYNIDLATRHTAIEIHANTQPPHTHPFYRKRIIYLLQQGWAVLYIRIAKTRPLTLQAGEYAAAFAEQAERDESLRGEYRVMWGTGELIAARRLDFDKQTLVPTPDSPH